MTYTACSGGFYSTYSDTTTSCVLVVVAAGHHLLASGPQQYGVLELRGVAAAHVAQRRVRVHHALVAQVLEGERVAGRAGALQPALAERERAEVLVYRVQKLL